MKKVVDEQEILYTVAGTWDGAYFLVSISEEPARPKVNARRNRPQVEQYHTIEDAKAAALALYQREILKALDRLVLLHGRFRAEEIDVFPLDEDGEPGHREMALKDYLELLRKKRGVLRIRPGRDPKD